MSILSCRLRTKLALATDVAAFRGMSGLFAIITDSGKVVLVTPAKGDNRIPLFTAEDKAEAFIGQYGREPMHPLRLLPLTVSLWIAKIRRAGAQFAIIDPPTEGNTSGVCPRPLDDILSMVMEKFHEAKTA